MSHQGLTIWLTGHSGAGKSTLARRVALELKNRGCRVEVLDGDIIRKVFSPTLGYTKLDRMENIRRIAFLANILSRNGIIVLVAAISPYRDMREEARKMIGSFLEVYVNAPIEVCESRDAKGLYKMAREGKLKHFTGIDDPYEPPLNPDVECRTDVEDLESSVQKVFAKIEQYISMKTN